MEFYLQIIYEIPEARPQIKQRIEIQINHEHWLHAMPLKHDRAIQKVIERQWTVIIQ